MNPEIITNDLELHARIMKLSYLKEEQELEIKRNVRELGYSLYPGALIKNFVGKFTSDPESMDNLKSLGLNIGKDFLISKIFGKGQTLKGFLGSMILSKVTNYFINKNPDLIRNGIEKLESFINSRKKTTEPDYD